MSMSPLRQTKEGRLIDAHKVVTMVEIKCQILHAGTLIYKLHYSSVSL
jgi:hypothetical protein